MKKIYLGLMVCAMPFLLTACGNTQRITCTKEEDGQKATVKLEYNKKKEEFTKGSMVMTVNYKELDDEDEQEMYEEYADEICDMYDDEDLYKSCKATSSKKEFKLELELTADGAQKQYKDKDVDEVVENLEDDDYKCTVR